MKTILVTGGCGFIGSNLVRFLVQEQACVVVNVDKLTYAGNLESLAELDGHPNYHFEQIDLACDPLDQSQALDGSCASGQKSLRAIFEEYQPDAVMHLAAESHVDRSIDRPGAFIQTNIVGTFNLLQASLAYWKSLPPQASVSSSQVSKESFRFLHVSTDEVYGSLAAGVSGFNETTAYAPHSPYSASKASADHLVRAWGDTYGLPVLITNCSNNYGAYQFPEKLIPVVILKCLRAEPIPVYGKGENIRDWLYVEDHVEALYTVLSRGRVGETYNIGGNEALKNIDLIKQICGLMDQFLPFSTTHTSLSADEVYASLITFVTDRPGHDLHYAIDSTKLRDELGWEPKQAFDVGLRKTVLWYLSNREWWENILSGDYQLDRLGIE